MLPMVAAAALLAAAPAEQDPQAPAVLAAVQAMSGGRPAEALTLIEPALAAYQRRYAGETRPLMCSYSPEEVAAEMADAAAANREVVPLTTSYCDALFIKGFSLSDLRRFDEAVPVLERVVAMAPHHAHYLSELGYAYQQQRNWEKSYATYARAADATAYSPRERVTIEKGRALRGMGYALIELGRWDEAERLYRVCLQLDPNDDKAKNELRYIAQQRQRPRA